MDLKQLNKGRLKLRKFIVAVAASASLAIAGLAPLAHADNAAPLAMGGDNWNMTIYGTVDVDYSYQTNGAAPSAYYQTGMDYLISKASNGPVSAITGNGMSQSKLGFKGEGKLTDNLSALFKLEIGFNPWSGELSNAVGSLVENNNVPRADKTRTTMAPERVSYSMVRLMAGWVQGAMGH